MLPVALSLESLKFRHKTGSTRRGMIYLSAELTNGFDALDAAEFPGIVQSAYEEELGK